MKVLVTDVQNRNAVAIIRSLGKRGIRIYAGDSDRISTGFFSKYVYKKVVYPDAVKEEQQFIQYLVTYIQRENIDILLPMVDSTIHAILKNRDAFKNVKIPFTDYSKLLQAGNKASTFKIAEKIGIPIPDTYYPETIEDLEHIKSFPVILKPRFSSGSRGLAFCKDKNELITTFKSRFDKYDGFIVQEFIPIADHENSEFDWYGIYDWNSELKAHGCFRRIRSYPIASGPSTLKESIESDRINQLATEILDHLKWQGLAQLDFRIDARDNQPKLMEINPRPWASIEHSIRVGVDVPGIWLKLALGQPVEKQPPIKTGVKSRWLLPGDILWFLSAPKTIKNIKAFFSFRNVDYELIQKGDLGPVFGFLLASVLYLFNKDKRQFIIRKKVNF